MTSHFFLPTKSHGILAGWIMTAPSSCLTRGCLAYNMRPSTHRLNAQLAEFNPNTHFLRSCSADRSGATAVRLQACFLIASSCRRCLCWSASWLDRTAQNSDFLFRLTPAERQKNLVHTSFDVLAVHRSASTADADSSSTSINCDLKPCSNTTCYCRRRIVHLLKTYNHNTISRFDNAVWRLTPTSTGNNYGYSLLITQHRQPWAPAQAVGYPTLDGYQLIIGYNARCPYYIEDPGYY
jgi:hypothetical protein